MFSLRNDVLNRGVTALRELVDNQQEEALHLEFKTLSHKSGTSITKEDRRLIAKAICGLVNAEGGLLLLGIGTKKVNGLDVADSLHAFDDAGALRNRLTAALPDLLSPQHPSIQVHVISEDTPRGCVMIEVPASDGRPHMSIPEHRYFRRGSDGTRVMEHGEVRDLMMAPQRSVLALSLFARRGMSSGLTFRFDLVLALENVGRVPVIAPYIRVSGAPVNSSGTHIPAGFSVRIDSETPATGIYASRDVVLHLEDRIEIASVPSGLIFHATDNRDAKGACAAVDQLKDGALFTVGPADFSFRERRPDQTCKMKVQFGGENAGYYVEHIDLNKWDLFELMKPALIAG